MTVSKNALVDELVYYGVDDVEEENIYDGLVNGLLPITAFNEARDFINKVRNEAVAKCDHNRSIAYLADYVLKYYLTSQTGSDMRVDVKKQI